LACVSNCRSTKHTRHQALLPKQLCTDYGRLRLGPGVPCRHISPTAIVNLTPHAITIMPEREAVVTIQPSGTVLRVSEEYRPESVILLGKSKILLGKRTMADCTFDPPLAQLPMIKSADVIYLVAARVAFAIADCAPQYAQRFLYPADLVRDDHGRVIGCRMLAAAT